MENGNLGRLYVALHDCPLVISILSMVVLYPNMAKTYLIHTYLIHTYTYLYMPIHTYTYLYIPNTYLYITIPNTYLYMHTYTYLIHT